MIWQILIATTTDRRSLFNLLKDELESQIISLSLNNEIEILFDEDNKEKSIGRKRQDLLKMATADYINYFDSDDWPSHNYIKIIYQCLMHNPDCVGILIQMTTNGDNQQICCHSLRYPNWEDKKDGYDYVRNVTHFNTVKRELALQVGFKDIRFGEDRDYSDRLTPLCKTEIFIEQPVFQYRYSNKINHNEKYGIK